MFFPNTDIWNTGVLFLPPLQRALQNLKNPGKHDILMAMLEQIHTYI
jgi:hypothetical protein